MWNFYTVSVYPKKNPDFIKIENYIKEAKCNGCKEIFSSAHLPELNIKFQYDFILNLCCLVHKYDMKVCVDFGGDSLLDLLNDAKYCALLKQAHIDSIRLDYGVKPNIVVALRDKLGTDNYVINASLINENEIRDYLKYDVNYKACHNFYPRYQTGLDEPFVKEQYYLFKKYGIDVICCVPSHTHPRGPIYEGLPTLEKHRSIGFDECLIEISDYCDEVLVGDEWIKEEEFISLHRIGIDKRIDIQVVLEKDITEQERNIVLAEHKMRYDSNSYCYRSQSSRQMAEFSKPVKPNNMIKRNVNDITIDNENFYRYSGELQIVKQNLESDTRVNVVGRVLDEDMWKLRYFRHGFIYRFVES